MKKNEQLSPRMDIPETHYNYVAFFHSTQRIKIGITGNAKKRKNDYQQEASRHGLGYVTFNPGLPQAKGVAMLVELTIRQSLKAVAIGKHHEWFVGGIETFEAFKAMTRRIQKESRQLLCLEKTHD